MLSKTEGNSTGGRIHEAALSTRKPGGSEHKMRLRGQALGVLLGPGAGCFGGTGCLPRAPLGAASRTGGSSCVSVCLRVASKRDDASDTQGATRVNGRVRAILGARGEIH